MWVAVLAGLTMVAMVPGYATALWFELKFLAVLGLIFTTLYAGRLVQRFKIEPLDQLPASKTLRVLNEVPTLLMMFIVAMAVFKPTL